MDFFDKLATALGVWGGILSFLGYGFWLIEELPFGKPMTYAGVGCLVFATLVWICT